MGFRGLRRELLRWHRGAALDLLGGRSQTDWLRRRGRLCAQRVEERSGRKVPRGPFDEDNESDQSEDRAAAWVAQIKKEGMPLWASSEKVFDRLRATTCRPPDWLLSGWSM